MASTRNYIVAHIDARGSGLQGIKLRREIQRRIGLIEVQDQLTVLTYLRDTFKFIDRSKICIVGKGYGGYVATMMLLQDFHQVVNCSISISPVANWRFYSKHFIINKNGSLITYFLILDYFIESGSILFTITFIEEYNNQFQP